MERLLSVEQMRTADEFTINNLGLSSEILIERAANAVVSEIKKRLYGGRVLVCIGKGNNGKDGQVIANMLSSLHGFTVATMNVSNGIFKMFEKKFDVIVDCIFGTGLNREVEGKYKTAIEKINESGAYVVSCDIASGLNGNTGMAMGVAVKANLTVAIQEYKIGHFLNDGPDYSGEIVAKDIGISIWGDDFIKKLNDSDMVKFFTKRARNVNKGSFGKTAIIGGSKKFAGSVLLSSNALVALKMGNGYSNLAIPNCLYNVCAGKNPECTLTVLSDDGENVKFNEMDYAKLLKYNSIAVGMGMGATEETYKVIKYLLENYSGRLVIDADGLNVLAKFGVEILKGKKCEVVLTPHVMEFSRLTGIDRDIILNDPIPFAKDFASKFGIILLLKNAVSIITDGKEVYLNTTGNSGMAKAGSGDVLSGITAGLLTRKFDAFEIVTASSYLFGKAGEFAVKNGNEYTVTATEIISALPYVINSLN